MCLNRLFGRCPNPSLLECYYLKCFSNVVIWCLCINIKSTFPHFSYSDDGNIFKAKEDTFVKGWRLYKHQPAAFSSICFSIHSDIEYLKWLQYLFSLVWIYQCQLAISESWLHTTLARWPRPHPVTVRSFT